MPEKKFKKGDILIWVSSLDNVASKKEVIVDSVGRKWLTIKDGWRGWRADIITLEVDINCRRGYGKLFRSENELDNALGKYLNKKLADKAWEKFKEKVGRGWLRPDGITERQILEAATIMGWDL